MQLVSVDTSIQKHNYSSRLHPQGKGGPEGTTVQSSQRCDLTQRTAHKFHTIGFQPASSRFLPGPYSFFFLSRKYFLMSICLKIFLIEGFVPQKPSKIFLAALRAAILLSVSLHFESQKFPQTLQKFPQNR